MKKLLILGATGQVGQDLLQLALLHPDIESVVAPTRCRLPVHPKLQNPLIDFDNLPVNESWWTADLMLCALGTTLRQAKSQAGFYRVDHDYVLAVAKRAYQAGTPVFGLVSSLGANAQAQTFYAQVKGEIENALADLGFTSLIIVRPSLLLTGSRSDRRPAEALAQWLGRIFGKLLPLKYRPVTTKQVAQALLQAGLDAVPGKKVIESEYL